MEDLLKASLSKIIESLYGPEAQRPQLTLTRKEFEGHYSCVVFPYLKRSRKSPEETAKEIGEALLSASEIVCEYNVVKGFLNISLKDTAFLEAVQHVLQDPNYGHKEASKEAPLYMVEYSSPNTNKPLHLGHIRNNLLGYSIAEILKAQGKRVVKTNIVNDRGVHICRSMLAWQKWGQGETPESSGLKGDHLIGKYYVLYNTKLQEQKAAAVDKDAELPLEVEVREMLRQWENGDTTVLALWRKMNSWVYDGFDETYKRLGVDFDKIYYESDTYLEGKKEVLRGLEEGLFTKEPDGSVWADLREEGLDRKILLRSDGTSVYMTQDIGTAKLRYRDYDIDKMIYVVGNEQEYHFQVLSILLDKLGFAFGKSLVHFSYGMVELPHGKMKSREGTVVDADDLMDHVIATAYKVAADSGKLEKLPEAEKKEVARKVGLGALKYFLLKVDPRKTLLFREEESIDFNGNTAPFLQYTYARIKSVLRQQNTASLKDTELSDLGLEDSERSLVLQILQYPEVLRTAAEDLSPAIIANYVYELAKDFNRFYHACSILSAETQEAKVFRLMLSMAVASVLERALKLLGIEVPEYM